MRSAASRRRLGTCRWGCLTVELREGFVPVVAADVVWVGVDAGKVKHHAAAIDADGGLLWSVKVSNDQKAIADLVARAVSGGVEGSVGGGPDERGRRTVAGGVAAGRAEGDLCARPDGEPDGWGVLDAPPLAGPQLLRAGEFPIPRTLPTNVLFFVYAYA
ncbi:MAG: IS110 family transposase [Actinobacteria bacterium]|nr:MAG: IS110 family transposase [Actinomycetota bacterium]